MRDELVQGLTRDGFSLPRGDTSRNRDAINRYLRPPKPRHHPHRAFGSDRTFRSQCRDLRLMLPTGNAMIPTESRLADHAMRGLRHGGCIQGRPSKIRSEEDRRRMPLSQTFSGNIVDVLGRRVRPGSLMVQAGRIVDIHWDDANYSTFLIPGFIDAHIHVESSLLPPREFARLAVVHGTVATVSDPHEIANVLGTAGVEYMLDDARAAPLKVYFGAPSCVPATPFDRAGATLSAVDVAALLDRREIKYLSEMMNYPGVIAGDAEVFAKLAAALRSQQTSGRPRTETAG